MNGPAAGDSQSSGICGNPFSTRYVRPGALNYRFAPAQSAETLVLRLAECNWLGQIVGPHGSGKSTLLAALLPAVQLSGRRVLHVALHDGQHRLPRGWRRLAERDQLNLIVVDGYEQLSKCRRMAIERACRRAGWGLLITTHRDLGLPTLAETRGQLPILQALAAELMAGRPSPLPASVVSACYDQAEGNVREALFLLYDRWEARATSDA